MPLGLLGTLSVLEDDVGTGGIKPFHIPAICRHQVLGHRAAPVAILLALQGFLVPFTKAMIVPVFGPLVVFTCGAVLINTTPNPNP